MRASEAKQYCGQQLSPSNMHKVVSWAGGDGGGCTLTGMLVYAFECTNINALLQPVSHCIIHPPTDRHDLVSLTCTNQLINITFLADLSNHENAIQNTPELYYRDTNDCITACLLLNAASNRYSICG